MKEAGWEIASHGLRWIDYSFVHPKIERAHLEQARTTHLVVVGEDPSGWYVGRCSPHIRKLLLEMGSWAVLRRQLR